MNFRDLCFYDDQNPAWAQRLIYVLLTLYAINAILFFLWNALLGGLVLLVWWAICGLFYAYIRPLPKYQQYAKVLYLPIVFVLAIIEEGMVFYIGGGLGGKAISLWHDLALAVPVFVLIGVAVLVLSHFKQLDSAEIYFIGSGIGFVVENIFGGMILWLAGGGMGIYAMMVLAPAIKPQNAPTRSIGQKIIIVLLGVLLAFIFGGIGGGILGDNIYNG